MAPERRLFLLFAILASLALTSPALAQQPPPGYQFFSGAPRVSGGLLLARIQRARSAIQTLDEGFRDTARFFDGRPQVVAGVADLQDQQAEATFRVSKGNVPLVGVATAVIEGETATLALAFDTSNTFPQSFPRLLQIAGLSGGSHAGGCPPPARNWRTVPYFDGSGQMTLPEGWQLTAAHQGVARAEGPHGIVESGITFSAISRAGAEQRARFGLPTLVLVADPTDLPSALVGVWTAVVRQGLTPPFRIRRVIESLSVPSQSAIPMQAGFLHYEIEHEGMVKRVLALVHMAALDADGQWVYFESHVIAPLSCFGQNLPALFQIWTSAQVTPHEFQRRLDAAMSSLHEAHEIHWQGMRNRSRQQDDLYAAWREQHIGIRVVEDTIGGTQRHVDHGHSTELVRRLNEQEPGRYREIPLRELNR
jgi:hypothetical protein